jgi:hypothetical protein
MPSHPAQPHRLPFAIPVAVRFALTLALVAGPQLGGPVWAQALNIDFGEPANAPAASYGAAGTAGVWNSLRADHGTTTQNLVGLDGQPTAVSLLQIGGLDTPTAADPASTGDDSLLMDDYLETFSAGLESCICLDGVAPGTYEVLVYAWMPNQPAVDSYTSVDQEPGFPHLEVGGAWPGGHQELVTYSRHVAVVGPEGDLDLHSGIVPGHNAAMGAALNGMQIRPVDAIFTDGFESGDTTAWSGTAPLSRRSRSRSR